MPPPTSSAFPGLEVEYPATLDHLSEMRERLRSWLAEEIRDDQACTDLLVVAGEFILHVIVRTGGQGRARITAERCPDGVRLAVMSTEETPAVRALDLPSDPLGRGALGRRLVEGCCDEVTVSSGHGVGAACWRAVRSA